jgi:hypothetical protein
VVSGRTEEALRANAARLAEADADLADIALTTTVHRAHLEHRAAVVADDRTSLRAGLTALASGLPDANLITGRPAGGDLAFLFTGQGSQRVGMGRELHERYPAFRHAYNEIAALLTPILDGRADFVSGSRRLGSTYRGDTFRYLGVILYAGLMRLLTGQAIAEGLAAVGVPLSKLKQASLDARGSTPYFGTGTDGSKLFVKALGADERSADLLFRIYRRLQPRDLGFKRSGVKGSPRAGTTARGSRQGAPARTLSTRSRPYPTAYPGRTASNFLSPSPEI